MAERPPFFFVDFDGTVVDNKRRMYQFCCDWYPGGAFGKLLTMDEYWSLKRMGVDELEWIDKRFAVEVSRAEWSALKLAHMEDDEYLALDVPFPGVRESLARLSAMGRVVLASRRERAGSLLQQLDRLDLARCFHDVVVVAHSGPSKALAIRERFEVECGDVVIGDTEDDIAAAVELGTRGFLVLSGIRGRWVLAEEHCPNNISSVEGIVEAVDLLEQGGYVENVQPVLTR